MLKGYTEMQNGLIGGSLGHSFSPEIHARLADYAYTLFPMSTEEVGDFLRSDRYHALNVTIPHKETVIPFLDALSPEAARIGSVNTITRQNGRLIGDNTDYYGFSYMLNTGGVDPRGKKVLVLGSGGASKTVRAVLADRGAAAIVTVSRTGDVNYENVYAHTDAALIVNTTPVGMYPNAGRSPIDMTRFPNVRAVFDLIYNPRKTRLLYDAEKCGIATVNGLSMLVAQAKRAAELFTGEAIDDSEIERVIREIERESESIVLIGMPGVGKSTVGRLLADACGRPFFDADAVLEETVGRRIPEIFATDGEAVFRKLESETVDALSAKIGCVIATGGGVVTRDENEYPLHQNGRVVFLTRDIRGCAKRGRPLSQGKDLSEMYRVRLPLYRRFADLTVEMEKTPQETVQKLLEVLQ